MVESSLKRKSDYSEEESDDGVPRYDDSGGFIDDEYEPHIFGASVLPVARLPTSFEGVPQDGLEYLFTVRREERQLPLVTRVPNPYAVQEKDQLGSDIKADCANNPPMNVIPSEEWRACFEERFRNLRTNLRQSTIHVSQPPAVSKIPGMRDRDRWWAFFRGDIEWENVPSSPFHFNQKAHKCSLSPPTADNTHPADPGDGICPREPTSHLLSLLDQKTTLHLLKYFTQWFQGHFDDSAFTPPPPLPTSHPDCQGNEQCLYDFTPCHGRWIFALLSHLDAQLTSDEISVLRKLARETVRLIKEIKSSPNSEGMSSTVGCCLPLTPRRSRILKRCVGEIACWMIIAAVCGGWGQKDLWVDAADVLR